MMLQFDACLKEGLAKRQQPDRRQALSLMAKADLRLAYAKSRQVEEKTAQFAFEDAYDVMREAGTALMVLRGFKPLSHDAVISFLRDREELSQADAETFDRFRRLRNKSLYEAQRVSRATAEEALQFAEDILGKLKLRL